MEPIPDPSPMPDSTGPNHDVPLRTWLLLGLVLASIVLQLVNASLLKFASSQLAARFLLVAAVLTVVMVLSMARFAVWGAMHKRFPVSITYPATALFFPCLVVLAWLFGEHVSFPQLVGAGLVTLGVFVLLSPHAASGTRPEP